MKVAIAGYGAEGRSNYAYYVGQGHDVTILDERSYIDNAPKGARVICGPDAFYRLSDFDIVVRTAGLAPSKLPTARKVWSATNEFLVECPAPIIGVTGSKGKGTTSSLIASILREAGKTVHLIGNIGVPALDVLPKIQADDVVVYEMSSFQLWDAELSPHVAVILHIEPDHLDVHTDFADYIGAKANIRRHQAPEDYCFYNPNNESSQWIAMQHDAAERAHCLPYNAHSANADVWVARYGRDGFYASKGDSVDVRICGLDALKLPGEHNRENATAAISAAMVFTEDFGAIERGLAVFHGLPHRLKYVRTVGDVAYYDDSIATTPGSAIAALRAFAQPKVLIMGGSSKGADFTELADTAKQSDVRAILAIGEEGCVIADVCRQRGVAVEYLGADITMDAVVARAAMLARAGDVVVLSPACASFGMFKNYVDRGDQFIAAVEQLS